MGSGMLRMLAVVLVSAPLLPVAAPATTPQDMPASGICMREGSKFVGNAPVRIGKSIRMPKKLRSATPRYPELPPGTRASGVWMGEVLLNNRGKVIHVWPIREVRLTPPYAAFNQAIVDSIRQSEFEPVHLKGTATAACFTTTVSTHWR